MERTIVLIEPSFPPNIQMKLSKAPINVADIHVPMEFQGDPDGMPSWANPHAVLDHGRKLFADMESHPPIRIALEAALGIPIGQVRPIFFHLRVPESERFYWESLCDNNSNFLALDRRWPIGRIADSPRARLAPYDFQPPLKVMALLSPRNIDATPEWQNLRDSIVDSRQNGLPVEVLIVTGQNGLLTAIENEIADGLAGVQVEPIPDRSTQIEVAITDFKPHILHFLCHGSGAHESYQLELATLLNWDGGDELESLRLGVNDLSSNMAVAEGVWLATLNCCEGGRATDQIHSMAHQLVANGIPAAIGALEPIDASDANEFCKGLYPSIFAKIFTSLQNAAQGTTTELEWVDALRDPRTNIKENHDNDPESNRQWALPVLYVRPQELLITNMDPLDPISRQRIQDATDLLKTLPPDTPVEARNRILEQFLAGIPEEFRPDKDGNFGN